MTNDFEFSKAAETKPKRGVNQPPLANMLAQGNTQPGRKPQPQAELPIEALDTEKVDEGKDTTSTPTKPKYDPEELARIFDEVIFSGEYSEEMILRGKLHIRLRTRTADEIDQITMLVDSTTANLVATLSEKRSVLNLQYALASYQGRDLTSLSVEDRSKYIKRLAGPMISALLKALSDFDAKVYAACQDGEENF